MQGEKVIIDLGQVQPKKGIDYFTQEEIDKFIEDVKDNTATSLDNTYESTANKVNYINQNSVSNQYPNAQITYKEFNKRDKKIDYVDTCNKGFRSSIPTETKEGEIVNLTECSNLPLNDFKLKNNGKNLFDSEKVVNLAYNYGVIVAEASYRAYYLKCTPGQVFTISRQSVSNNRFRYGFTKVEPVAGINIYNLSANYDTSLKIENIVVPVEMEYIFFYLSNSGDNVSASELMIEQGSTATDYEPYKTITRR